MNPTAKMLPAVVLLTASVLSGGCQQKIADETAWTPQDNWRITAPPPYPRTLSERPASTALPTNEALSGQGERGETVIRKQYTFDDP